MAPKMYASKMNCNCGNWLFRYSPYIPASLSPPLFPSFLMVMLYILPLIVWGVEGAFLFPYVCYAPRFTASPHSQPYNLSSPLASYPCPCNLSTPFPSLPYYYFLLTSLYFYLLLKHVPKRQQLLECEQRYCKQPHECLAWT
jgi:hypothetical protein